VASEFGEFAQAGPLMSFGRASLTSSDTLRATSTSFSKRPTRATFLWNRPRGSTCSSTSKPQRARAHDSTVDSRPGGSGERVTRPGIVMLLLLSRCQGEIGRVLLNFHI
jgi:hypothetical protein